MGRRGKSDSKKVVLALQITIAILFIALLGLVLYTTKDRDDAVALQPVTLQPTAGASSSLQSSSSLSSLSSSSSSIENQSATPSKAMLSIIIDDVASAQDVKAIRSTLLNLTLSFLPPSKIHPSTSKLAKLEPYYMVHIPLEALSYGSPEPSTLKLSDTQESIESRVAQIVKLFPKVEYINNHTGSAFTSNIDSMRMLIYALDRYNITFIDSRTIASTAVDDLAKELHRPYIARDIFLDHEVEVEKIKEQIKKAIEVAKRRGVAIAIAHPHKQTIEALIESRDLLLKEVDLVRIDQLVPYIR